jgi:tetratricopeptide (TPR) repeat protein
MATKADEKIVQLIKAQSSVGVMSLNSGKHIDAHEAFSKVIAGVARVSDAVKPLIKEAIVQAFLGRGSALMLLAQFNPAIADFTSVIEVDPTCIDAYKRRGLTNCAKGDNHAAVKDLDLALAMSKKSLDANRSVGDNSAVVRDMDIYRQRAVVHHRRQDYVAAVADLQVSIYERCSRCTRYFRYVLNLETASDCACALCERGTYSIASYTV